MDRNHDPFASASHCKNMVATVTWLGCAFFSQQPTFDRFMNIRADILCCFALGDASRQCWHFRPVSTFFRFMNEHLQCHESILLHRRIPRKTDLWRLSSASRSSSLITNHRSLPLSSPRLSTINTQLTTLLRFLRSPITDLSRRSCIRTLVGVGGSRITSAFSASSGSFFNFFAGRDTGKQYDPGRSLGGSILTEGRFERQFSGSDLG